MTFPSGVLLERFLIVQLELLTHQWNDEQDDQHLLETAVLYYYHHHQQHSHPGITDYNNNNPNNTIDDSLRLFLGLCSALYALPNEMMTMTSTTKGTPTATTQPQSMEVQLSSSTRLIFIEIETNILAVAQISNFHQQQHPTSKTTTTTRVSNIAIQDSVRNVHRYFCLLRGGTIRKRLGFGINEHKNSYNKRMVEVVTTTTTIKQLQTELRIHYESYLLCGEFMAWIAPIPAPIPVVSQTHQWYVAPVIGISNTVVQTQIQMTLHEILQLQYPKRDTTRNDQAKFDGADGCWVVGIATFARGQLQQVVMTAASTDHPRDDHNNESHIDRVPISNATAVLLMQYMSQFQYQQSKCHAEEEEIGRGLQQSFSPTPHHRSTFALLDDTPMYPSTQSLSQLHKNIPSSFGFLSPPPLSLLSALEDTKNHAFEIPRDVEDDLPSIVWAPPVYLPKQQHGKDANDHLLHDCDHYNARLALYSCGEFSFLLFVSCNTDNDERLLYPYLFQDIHKQFLKIKSTMDLVLDSSDHEEILQTREWRKPGQTIVSVNRKNHNLILFPDPAKNAVHETLQSPSTLKTAGKYGPADLVGLFSPKKQPTPQQQPQEHQVPDSATGSRSMTSSILAPDCRHLLLSQLSPDCLLALQDAMEEVRQLRRPCHYYDETVDDELESSPFELCSLLHNDWIYAWANHYIELYVILDSAYYVTVADVHNAVTEIRKELL